MRKKEFSRTSGACIIRDESPPIIRRTHDRFEISENHGRITWKPCDRSRCFCHRDASPQNKIVYARCRDQRARMDSCASAHGDRNGAFADAAGSRRVDADVPSNARARARAPPNGFQRSFNGLVRPASWCVSARRSNAYRAAVEHNQLDAQQRINRSSSSISSSDGQSRPRGSLDLADRSLTRCRKTRAPIMYKQQSL